MKKTIAFVLGSIALLATAQTYTTINIVNGDKYSVNVDSITEITFTDDDQSNIPPVIIEKEVRDTIQITDTLIKEVEKIVEVRDTIQVTDTLIKEVEKIVEVTDTVQVTDTIIKEVEKIVEVRDTVEINAPQKAPFEYKPRAIKENSYASVAEIVDFMQAPGQFVNNAAITGQTAVLSPDNKLDIIKWAETQWFRSTPTYLSLGGWGGYVTGKFDHSVPVTDSLAIQGNAFAGSSEPGIVWISQDVNNNGVADDPWYAFVGASESQINNYWCTYYRPEKADGNVAWKDIFGNEGTVDHNTFHPQCYYPEYVQEDSYTLFGAIVNFEPIDKNGNGSYWVNPEFEWGYVDNYGKDTRSNFTYIPLSGKSKFLDKDGNEFKGEYIDFVKVQTGANAKAGAMGENSTECFGIYQASLKDKLDEANKTYKASAEYTALKNAYADTLSALSTKISDENTILKNLKKEQTALADTVEFIKTSRAWASDSLIKKDALKVLATLVQDSLDAQAAYNEANSAYTAKNKEYTTTNAAKTKKLAEVNKAKNNVKAQQEVVDSLVKNNLDSSLAEEELAQLQAKLDTLNDEYSELTTKVSVLSAERTTLNSAKTSANSALSKAKTAVKNERTRIDNVLAQSETTPEQYADILVRFYDTTSLLERAQEIYDSLVDSKDTLTAERDAEINKISSRIRPIR